MKRYIIPVQTQEGQNIKIQIQAKDISNIKRKVKAWSVEEDERLVRLHSQHPKKWNVIAELMGNRNQNQCLHRFRRIAQIGAYKKIWSQEEDDIVVKMVKEVGHNWKIISNKMGTKTGKQIRQRFINKLDPNIKRDEWTQEQDLKLIQLYSKYGSKWCQISKQIQGRPQNKIKNRFYSYIQKNYSFKVQKEGKTKQTKQLLLDHQNKENQYSFSKCIQKNSSKRNFGTQHNQFNCQSKNFYKNQQIKYKEDQIFNEKQSSQMEIQNEQYNKNQIQDEFSAKVQKKEQSMKEINDINDITFIQKRENDFLFFQDNE